MNGLQGLYISLGTCEQPHGPALQADHINARCPAKKKKNETTVDGKYPANQLVCGLPSRGLTYPTLGKGKSSSKCHFWGIC